LNMEDIGLIDICLGTIAKEDMAATE